MRRLFPVAGFLILFAIAWHLLTPSPETKAATNHADEIAHSVAASLPPGASGATVTVDDKTISNNTYFLTINYPQSFDWNTDVVFDNGKTVVRRVLQ